MMTTKTTASTQWIKKNMLGYYPEELGRSLTEAEVRFQNCTEQLPVPDWYRKYHKPYPFNYLKNSTPIESRPSPWKTLASDGCKSSSTGSPKEMKRSSFKKAPQDAEPPRTSSADSGFGDTFCLSPRTLKSSIDTLESSFAPCSTSSPAPPASNASNDVRDELDGSSSSVTMVRRRLNTSSTFPRMSPSRKIEHINLVFSKPFPAEQEPLTLEDTSNAGFKRTNAGGTVQSIIHELDRSTSGYSPNTAASSTMTYTISESRSTFVRSMVEAIEQADKNASGVSNISDATYIVHSEEDEEIHSDDSTDSDLAKSTSISVKSYDSPDERTVTPLYSACIAVVETEAEEEESESDEEVYWAPCRLIELPRTSSRLSMTSSMLSAKTPGESPELSPIRCELPEDWLPAGQHGMQRATNTWNLASRGSERSSSRRLPRIDETDFCYSAAFVSAPIFV